MSTDYKIIPIKEHSFIIHTNHFLAPEMASHDIIPSQTSKLRFNIAKQAALSHGGPIDSLVLKKILSIHPHICRHTMNGTSTVGGIIAEPRFNRFHITLGRVCNTQWQTFYL